MRQKTYFDLEEDWAVRIGKISPKVRDGINKLLTDFAVDSVTRDRLRFW